jgi:hypothetical protein
MRVKNLNRATQTKCSSGTWLALWEKASGQNAFLCFVKDCINRPSTGGLVQKDIPTDEKWYVVPLCDDCSKRTGQDLNIWDMATLVPSDEMGILPRATSSRPVRILRTVSSLRYPPVTSGSLTL